jgi:DNA-binding CsgD family transcriptional regulator
MAKRAGYRWSRKAWRPSAAQARVLEELARGRTNAEIAVRLGISPETVKSHVAALLEETGSPDRQALARWWLHQGDGRPAVALLPLASLRLALAAIFVAAGVVALVAVRVVQRNRTDVPGPSVGRIVEPRAAPEPILVGPPARTPLPRPSLAPAVAALAQGAAPALGDVPGDRFLGRFVLELSWGAQVPWASHVDWYSSGPLAARVTAALERADLVAPTTPDWPTSPIYFVPEAWDAFRGRLVADIWESTVRVALTVAAGSTEDLLLTIRWWLLQRIPAR